MGKTERARSNCFEKQEHHGCLFMYDCNAVIFFKRKMLDRKRRINDDRRVSGSDTDNDYDGYEDDGIIPG